MWLRFGGAAGPFSFSGHQEWPPGEWGWWPARFGHFKKEPQADGTVKVVAYIRDSRTGELRREHPEPGQDPAPTRDTGPGEWLPS